MTAWYCLVKRGGLSLLKGPCLRTVSALALLLTWRRTKHNASHPSWHGACVNSGNSSKAFVPLQASSIGLLAAWRIPGVASFAATLFFCKLVAYTFLYWLPYYLSTSRIGGRRLSAQVPYQHMCA